MSSPNRDPQTILPRVESEFGTLLAHLFAAIEHMDMLDQNITPEQARLTDLAQQVKADLITLNGNAKLLLALMLEMGGYIGRLRRQHQTAQQAFTAGWESRYDDIIARLNTEDYAQLYSVLNRIAGDDSMPY